MPAVAVAIGQVISNYRVVRPIGEGGMGAVFEVAHIHIGQRAALKAMTVDLKTDPGLFQRFVNEARAVSQIDHPCVVKVIDFGQFPDGSPWMIMEYLKGEPLSARLLARRPGLEGLWIIADLASALAATHAAGIVHRDLKPSNVMLVPDPLLPTGERAKLLDFGVAKLCDDSLTKSGAMLGTPMYMSPEQIKNSAAVDGKSDVYALGVILYQMLCGRLPFEARETFALLAAKSFYQPIPLAQYAPELPAAVLELTMAMLEREPAPRPTMVEVEHQVRRQLGLPPPRQSGWHPTVTASPTAKTLPPPADGDPGAAIAVAAPAPPRAELFASPPTPSGEKNPEPPRRPTYAFFAVALALSAVGTWAALRDWHPTKPIPVSELHRPVDLSVPPESLAPPALPGTMDLAVSPDLSELPEPAPPTGAGHVRKDRERDHGRSPHPAAKAAGVEPALGGFEVHIQGATPEQQKLIRACCDKNLKSLTAVPHSYQILLERSGSLHIIDAPEAVRQTDLALCLRQAFATIKPPESVTLHIRGGR